MRIAHVTSGLDRNAAGVGVVVSEISKLQQSRGHEVRVFGLASMAWMQGDHACWRGAPAEALPIRGIPRSFGYAPGMRRALLQFEPDVIHLHGLWMYPAWAVLNFHRQTGTPYIYSAHGMLSQVALAFGSWKKYMVRHLFQDEALRHASVLHATTASESKEFRDYGLTNRIEVVPLGIHATDIPEVYPSQFKRILSLGRLHPKKGLSRLIEAWSQLEAKFPQWCLELVGPDERGHMDELWRLAKRLKIERLTIKAPIHGADRDRCMASAEIFVLPTHSDNFALTVAESLMMETPVIATRGAPWAGLEQEDCGWWIDQGVEPLARALEEAMSLSDHQRKILGRRGRAWMLRDYAWGSVADRIVNIYQDTIY